MMICLRSTRQVRVRTRARLATTSEKISREPPRHKLITRTTERLVGSPTVSNHPNKRRKIGRGAPEAAKLRARTTTTKLTSQQSTASRNVLCQVDNNLTITLL
jgi:hypothetical protein